MDKDKQKKQGRLHLKGKRIFFDDKSVILKVRDGMKTFISKAEDGDEFDLEKGIMSALLKSEGYTYGDIQHLMKKATDKSEIGRVMKIWKEDENNRRVYKLDFDDDDMKTVESLISEGLGFVVKIIQ